MDHSTESQTDRKELKKTMSPAEVWALAVGAIIGWGCFVLPGTRFLPDAGPLGTCLAFLIGGRLIRLCRDQGRAILTVHEARLHGVPLRNGVRVQQADAYQRQQRPP